MQENPILNWAFPMATYSVSCVGAKLTLDTDQQTVTIQRDPNVLMALPAETVCRIHPGKGPEHTFQDFGYGHGTGMIKFLYPGCPAGGDILLGHTTHENIVQYKGRAANDAKAFWMRSTPCSKPLGKSNPSIFPSKKEPCGSFLFPSGRPLSTAAFLFVAAKYLQPQPKP